MHHHMQDQFQDDEKLNYCYVQVGGGLDLCFIFVTPKAWRNDPILYFSNGCFNNISATHLLVFFISSLLSPSSNGDLPRTV